MTAWASPRRSGASTPPSPRPRWPSTAPASWPSSRPRRRRPARSSTPWSARRRSRGRAGWRPRVRSTPRTRCCASWPTWPGCRRSAGGCFVSGGSAGNLSALAVARETGRSDRGGGEVGGGGRHRALVRGQRAGPAGAARARGADGRRRCLHRGRASGRPGRPSPRRVRGRRVGRLHQRRPHRRPGRPGRGVRRAQEPGCTSTAPTAWPRCSPRRSGRRSPGSKRPTR